MKRFRLLSACIVWQHLVIALFANESLPVERRRHGFRRQEPPIEPGVSEQDIEEFTERNALKTTPPLQEVAPGDSFIVLDGVFISIDDKDLLAVDDTFTDNATYMIDGIVQTVRPTRSLYQYRKDKSVTIAKEGNRLVWASKKEQDGKTKEVFPIDDESSVFATVSSDDVDMDVINDMFLFGDAPEVPVIDGTPAPMESNETLRHRSLSGCTKFGLLEVAIAYNSDFCASFGNSPRKASSAATSIVAAASLMYEQAGLCKRIKITHLEGSCNGKGPYDSMINANEAADVICNSGLERFAQFWRTNRRNVRRDAAHLFYGLNSNKRRVIGCAYRSVLCNRDYGYGAEEITFNANPFFRSQVFAHEMAHAAGASHDCEACGDYIMKPNICPDCDKFSPTSIREIRRHAHQSSCISPEKCSRDSQCIDKRNKCRVGTCESGECRYKFRDCDDKNKCTISGCNKDTGKCFHRPKCNDGDKCTVDTCDPQTGSCNYTPKSCDDGKKCTVSRCDWRTGRCLHRPKTCSDRNRCTIDSCDERTGICTHTNKSCDDGNHCTVDSCDRDTGSCVHLDDVFACPRSTRCAVSGDVCNRANPCCDGCRCMRQAIRYGYRREQPSTSRIKRCHCSID